MAESDTGQVTTATSCCCLRRRRGASDKTTPRGFEPLRAEPHGFRVHLLNHSDAVSQSQQQGTGDGSRRKTQSERETSALANGGVALPCVSLFSLVGRAPAQ